MSGDIDVVTALALGVRRVEWTELPLCDRERAAGGLLSIERVAIGQTIHELEYGAARTEDIRTSMAMGPSERARCLAQVLRNLLGWPSSSGHPPCIPTDSDYRTYEVGLAQGYEFTPTDSRTGQRFRCVEVSP